jgi:hypothetical protein
MRPRLRDGSAGMCEATIAATHSVDDPMGAGRGRVGERANLTESGQAWVSVFYW